LAVAPDPRHGRLWAGGGTDVATRIIAEPLGDALGQRFVVENKPGAGGTIAGDLVAKGPKDATTP